MFMSRSLLRFARVTFGFPQPHRCGRIIGGAISFFGHQVRQHSSLASLLNQKSSTSLSIHCIRQTGLGQHAGGWSAPVNQLIDVDAGRFNSRQTAMPMYGQPGTNIGAGAEHGGRTP